MNTKQLSKTFKAFGLSFNPATDTYTTGAIMAHRSRCAELARNMANYPSLKEMFYKEFKRA